MRCEPRAQLSALAAKLQTQRIDALLASRAELVERIKLLCQQLPPGHPSRPAAAFCDAPGSLDGADGDEDGEGVDRSGGRGSGGRRGGPSDSAPENEIEDSWVQIAEEEERNPRRATVPGTLNKMLQAVAKHKWAYPFKRPVTDKEAPDYREVITNVRAPEAPPLIECGGAPIVLTRSPLVRSRWTSPLSSGASRLAW